MNDSKITLADLKKKAQQFVQERDWQQFHTPKNLSMAIATEAAEIMEPFKWVKSDDSLEHFKKHQAEIEHEMADVLITLLCLANITNTDISLAFEKKLQEIKKKYPIHKVKGRADKYTTYR